jgi:multidrug efflux system membrane fusion protein
MLKRRPAGTWCVAALLVFWCGPAASGCRRSQDEGPVAGETIAVTVQEARLGALRDTVTASGNVVPSAAADQLVTATEPAEIAELPRNEGDKVQGGDLLVRLEVPSVTNQLTTAQLELAEATKRLEAAKADETRLDSLVTQGLAARNKLEAARTARVTAESAVGLLKAKVDSAKALGSDHVIRARFAGVVAKRWHAPGDMVAGGEGDPILRVIDPTRLQVAMQVPRAQADRINQGQPASVQTGTGTEPAMVAMKGLPAGETAPTIEIRLSFASASALPLDSIVQAEIVLEEFQNVIVIPAGAVQTGDKGTFVWLATDAMQATKRDVRVGLSVTGMTQVISGLVPGDRVILTGIAQLAEGSPITIGK